VQSFCTIFGHRGRSDSGSINDGSSPSHAHRRRRRRRRRGGGEGGGGGGRGDNIEADYEMCDMKSDGNLFQEREAIYEDDDEDLTDSAIYDDDDDDDDNGDDGDDGDGVFSTP